MPQLPLKPFWTSPDGSACNLYHGDVVAVLKRLPAKSVHCCVTSPPYWGLRDYGTGTWSGGDPNCEHKARPTGRPSDRNRGTYSADGQYRDVCGSCGANRIDQQIGSERTPEEFVAKMVEVFREVRRVLRNDGTLWLNLGDSYGANGQLIGIPWRVALALQADGWVLRSDIPWVKRAAMPESVTNRPAKALEYVFMLAKGKGYYYDAEAVRKNGRGVYERTRVNGQRWDETKANGDPQSCGSDGTRNFRNADPWFESVEQPWGVVGVEGEIVGIDVTSQGYEGAHFATYPPNLIRPFILAGTSERGCCGACGCPWRRVVEERGGDRVEEEDRGERDRSVGRNRNGITGSLDGTPRTRETTGWEPGCGCGADVAPCVVLDPFMGSGTTAAVALEYERRAVGIDLSEQYLKQNAIPRIYEVLTGNPAYRNALKKESPKRMTM